MRLIIAYILIIMIGGCTTVSRKQIPNVSKKPHHLKTTMPQDGAPAHPPRLSYSKVTPKAEPMSRYGNPESYRVNGRLYEVIPNASGYKTKGIASWYGTKFHKKRTSSGEDYDMYAMTAAHPTLPLPSYIRVKNLNNGRIAIVRVNDRGPFHSNRLIDLSYAAATYLGLLPKGTAPVEIQALTPSGKNKTKAAHYYIQAGAFESKSLANTLVHKLNHLTASPVFIEKYQNRFLVKIGPFPNKQTSAFLRNKLSQQGIHNAFSFLQ